MIVYNLGTLMLWDYSGIRNDFVVGFGGERIELGLEWGWSFGEWVFEEC
jgi:hypothetical protein